ncbi:hypothetical protein [uncultured Sphingomonas sp.]|uniref:hypothetical protein n=1 Tax=uncultured Sphingomonas sp. TaxID=158754 RepID=UPI0035C9D0DC
MTLCGAMYSGASFVAFGDVMLSRRFAQPVPLPTTIGSTDDESLVTPDGYSPSRLHQKIVLINANTLMLWSGLYTKARLFYRYLCSCLSSCRPTPDEVRRIISRFPDSLNPEDIEICVIVIDKNDYAHPMTLNTVMYPLETIDGFLTLGSGTEDAFNPLLQDIIESAILSNKCAMSALRFFGSALIQQSLHGYGLQKSWGGGFEIVVKSEVGFTKINEILVRGWTVHKDQVWKLVPTKYWFFQAYENGILKVFPITPNDPSLSYNPFVAKSFDPRSRKECLIGSQTPSHVIDLTFPITYSMSNPNGMMINIAASDCLIEKVDLDPTGYKVSRNIKAELDLLWSFLSEFRKRGVVL